MAMDDKFKDFWKIIKKRYRSVVLYRGVFGFLLNEHSNRLLPLAWKMLLRYTKVKNVLKYRH